MWTFLSIIIICVTICFIYPVYADKQKAIEVAHEKSFWGNDNDDNNYQEQIDNLKLKVKELETEVKQYKKN